VQSEFCARSDTSHLDWVRVASSSALWLGGLVMGPRVTPPRGPKKAKRGRASERGNDIRTGPHRCRPRRPYGRPRGLGVWPDHFVSFFVVCVLMSSLTKNRCAVTSCGRMHGVPCGGAGFAQEYNGSSNCQSNGSDMSLDGSSFWTVG
jgi:hypothetical protein